MSLMDIYNRLSVLSQNIAFFAVDAKVQKALFFDGLVAELSR